MSVVTALDLLGGSFNELAFLKRARQALRRRKMSRFKIIRRILKKGFLIKKVLLCLSGILLLIFISANAQAYLFQQLPGSDPTLSYNSNANISYDLARTADDFTLSSATTINSITWWGFNEAGGWTETKSYQGFTFTFYADNSGIPGASFLTIDPVTLISANADGNYSDPSVWVYTAALNVSLNAGTYWLSIYDKPTDSSWGWMMSDGVPDGVTSWSSQKMGAGDWSQNAMYSNAAFELTGSQVPIPTAAWLLALGLVGLAVVRRRIRR